MLVAAVLVCAAAVALWRGAEHLAQDDETALYYAILEGELLDDYSHLTTVAHNSGNRPATLQLALDYNADVTEIDVRLVNGQLRARHSSPLRFLGRFVATSAPLSVAWEASADIGAIKLDLKQSSPLFLSRLSAFLAGRTADHDAVIVSSRSLSALERLKATHPEITALLSVSSSQRLHAVLSQPAMLDGIDGVSVNWHALDSDSAAWLEERGLLLYTWVVNDLETLNRAADWGADGITTDNLAIIELIHAARTTASGEETSAAATEG